MGKNIYELLNEIEMDFTEYEDLELSSLEKEAYKKRILREVKHMENKKKKRTKTWMIATGTAAACALIVVAVGVANPTLAENLFSSTFGKLIDNSKGEKYEEEYTAIFSKIGENAIEAEAEVEKHQDEETYTTTAESNDVTVSVSDIYCDGYVLYYTATLKTDNEGLKQADGISSQNKVGGVTMEKLDIEGMDMSGYFSNSFEKSEDGSFVSVQRIDLISEMDQVTSYLNENKPIVIDWSITGFIGNVWDRWDAQGEYETTGIVNGEWHLRFPVTVDNSVNEAFAIDKEENGIIVKDAVKTKAGLVVHIQLPDFRKAPYNDPYNDPDIGIKDTQGNYLQWLSQRHSENEDGTSESWIMVLYNGEKDLSFKVTTKDKNQTNIADIAFQIP